MTETTVNANEGDRMTRTSLIRTTRSSGMVVLVAVLAACGGTAGSDGPQTATVSAGTEMVVRLDQELSTRSHRKGDEFTARLASTVRTDGAAAIPAGAVVHGRVTGVQQASSDGTKGVVKLQPTSVELRGASHELAARVLSADPEVRSETSTGEAAAKVGGSAAAGAILGRVIGGDGAGAAVGAAVGAAAGTGIVLATKDGHAVLPEGSDLRLELTEPLTVPLGGRDGESESSGEAT